MKKEQRYKIVRIGKADGFYGDRAALIGQTGKAKEITKKFRSTYISCFFRFDQEIEGFGQEVQRIFFHKILLKKIFPTE